MFTKPAFAPISKEALELLTAGTYDIIDEKKEAELSLNFDRIESSTDCFEKSEIISSLENESLKHVSFSLSVVLYQ